MTRARCAVPVFLLMPSAAAIVLLGLPAHDFFQNLTRTLSKQVQMFDGNPLLCLFPTLAGVQRQGLLHTFQ